MSLIDSDGIAVTAVLLGPGIEVLAVWAAACLVRLARNWHRHQRLAPASVPVP